MCSVCLPVGLKLGQAGEFDGSWVSEKKMEKKNTVDIWESCMGHS